MRKVLSVWLVLLIVLAVFMPGRGLAEDELQRRVRVGWFDSTFNSIDAYGRRTGYAYEYQRKIAAYTGWQYEYVEGSWVDLYVDHADPVARIGASDYWLWNNLRGVSGQYAAVLCAGIPLMDRSRAFCRIISKRR